MHAFLKVEVIILQTQFHLNKNLKQIIMDTVTYLAP